MALTHPVEAVVVLSSTHLAASVKYAASRPPTYPRFLLPESIYDRVDPESPLLHN